MDQKRETRDKVLEWAKGLVILKHPFELAWMLVIEWADVADLGQLDPNILRQYVKFFGNKGKRTTGLAYALEAFLESPLSPFPPIEEDEEDDKKKKGKKDDETKEGEKPDESKSEEKAEEEAEDEPVEEDDEPASDPILRRLHQALEHGKTSAMVHRIAAMYFLSVNEYESAVDACRASTAIMRNNVNATGLKFQKIKDAFSVVLGNALVHYQSPKHHPEAKKLFEDVLTRNDSYGSALVGLGLILEEQQDYDGALEFLEKALENNGDDVKIRSEVAWVKVLMERFEEGLEELESCLELVTGKDAASRDLRAQILWRIGQGLWNSDVEGRGDPDGARAFFVKAIQQNQNYAPAYTSLGIFFADVNGDIDRANKCFQKAFELSAGEVEAAERLARNFAESREWELVEIVARRVAQAEKKRSIPGKGVSWPQAAIGVVELNAHNHQLAIQAFQAALRVSPDDFHSWVGLGEAYVGSGRYIAALKVFEQAQKLDPDNWFAKYMAADVHKALGDFDEAVAGYRAVLQIRGEEFGVLMSLAETLVQAASQFVVSGQLNDMVDVTRELFEVAPKIIKVRPDAFNLWKAVGDACVAFSWYKRKAAAFPVQDVQSILMEDFDTKEYEIISDVDEIGKDVVENLHDYPDTEWPLRAAVLAYKRGLYASADDRHAHAVAWYNLGTAEYRLYSTSKPPRTEESKYRSAAIQCFKRAIKLEPGNNEFWNALGTATAEISARVSQHALCRSLHINERNPLTWTNLGTLYLMNNDLDLAHEAFKRAQSADPEYAHAWVGQGIVSLLNGLTGEALDLFEHAYQIAHSDTIIVNRQFATSTFDHISVLFAPTPFAALIDPLLALSRLEDKTGNDTAVLRLHALFAERAEDFATAIAKLEKVCEIVEGEYETSEADEDLVKFCQAKSDLARNYLGNKDFEQAIEHASMALELSEDNDQLKICRLSAHVTAGVAHFRLGQTDESLELFKKALDESKDDPEIIVLLAQMLYAKGGENEKEVAEQQLFEVIEAHPDHTPSALLLGAFGVLEGKEEIIEAIQEDLEAQMHSDKISPFIYNQIKLLLDAVKVINGEELYEPAENDTAKVFQKHSTDQAWRSLPRAGDEVDTTFEWKYLPKEDTEGAEGAGNSKGSGLVDGWCIPNDLTTVDKLGWRGGKEGWVDIKKALTEVK
ncbi:hypothetical protein BJ508DRAFT_143997 [Ascobolus immersus RN42]|uniref:TPR-like protein n=1 Tax=Ascobolus immersus RN42 TaxID=1160509 RepID=A0A3N4IBL9_ASCIM|nr:hypothetical protein BJ508DRAFT_143997 [Ascobolus immersus RN42]